MQGNYFQSWGTAVLTPLQDLWARFLLFLPNLIGAIVILLIGWLIAVGLDRLVTQILKQIKLDNALNKVGTRTLLSKGGFHLDFSDFIGALVKWSVLLITFLATADVLGLSEVSILLNKLIAYLPNIFVAVAVLLIGALFAHFLAGVVRGTVGAARIKVANFLGAFTKWVVYIFAILIALNQLGIAATIINNLIIAIFFAAALALGLSFGLGGQKSAAKLLEEIQDEFKHKER